MRAALRPFDLTHVQYVLLASLTWLQSDEPVTQQRLAQHARTDPMMTSQVLRALEMKGLVERRPHPVDARARSLHVTGRGVDLANRATAVVEKADRAWFAPLGRELDAFTRNLRTLSGRG
jgi:DNA-binding MarR family transcriptional regulator